MVASRLIDGVENIKKHQVAVTSLNIQCTTIKLFWMVACWYIIKLLKAKNAPYKSIPQDAEFPGYITKYMRRNMMMIMLSAR